VYQGIFWLKPQESYSLFPGDFDALNTARDAFPDVLQDKIKELPSDRVPWSFLDSKMGQAMKSAAAKHAEEFRRC
jgi:hypothetical protein